MAIRKLVISILTIILVLVVVNKGTLKLIAQTKKAMKRNQATRRKRENKVYCLG